MNFRVLDLQEVTGWSDKKIFVTKKLHRDELKLVFFKKIIPGPLQGLSGVKTGKTLTEIAEFSGFGAVESYWLV